MRYSFWEEEYYNDSPAIIIIGGGIVGLSTALSIRERSPTQSVIVVERHWPPQGASTKNAGFVCFGSLTETLSDIKTMDEKEVISLIKMRWDGVQLLRQRLPKHFFKNTEGYELFDRGFSPNKSDITLVNDIFQQAIGIKNYMKAIPNLHFNQFDDQLISLPEEGMLNPMEMMNHLKASCIHKGVKFYIGSTVTAINSDKKTIEFAESESLTYEKCIVCTNGFAKQLLPNLPVEAVRNQVMMTSKIANLKWQGVFHYQEGYYYFRNYNDRILIGGARNLDLERETTDFFGFNEKIINHLNDFLHTNVVPNMNFEIVKSWSGILGVGHSKMPIVEKINEDLIIGVRLGGMGVAIGSYLGHHLANLTLQN